MGYPYDVDELVIVDLPTDERHELYDDDAGPTELETRSRHRSATGSTR